MEKREKANREYYAVDLRHIFKALWHRAWLIVLVGLLSAGIGFSIASYVIPEKYSSSIMLYVNNSSFSVGNTSFSISSSEITAAQSLVKTYSVILDNRTTLERVIAKVGGNYTDKELSRMITTAAANDTEIMRVTITTTDPYEASKIANCIAEVLPIRISEIIDGASMEVVDSAVPKVDKVAPNITRYTAVGLIVGTLFIVIVLAIIAMLDDTIQDEEYVLQNYDYPILAKVPDLLSSGSKSKSSYAYYQKGKTTK
ncbi:MAG: hypothetical protein IKU25_03100 [Clostridia bacterium]|nr:hypothetical protein [Clostridia bacterium]